MWKASLGSCTTLVSLLRTHTIFLLGLELLEILSVSHWAESS